MSSPSKETEEISPEPNADSNGTARDRAVDGGSCGEAPRPPAKRSAPAVIEISDTDSDDSDICAVTSYQASADEVKRIRGADYSSSPTSSSDYSSDSDSPWEDDSLIVEDEKKKPKVVRALLNLRANRTDDPLFNSNIKSQEVVDSLSTNWEEMKDYKENDIILTCKPFRLCLLHNFLANPEIINNIVDDMNTLDWSRKKMDLYEFHQTADLASLTWQRSIRGIYELLKTDFMSWMSQVTGLELNHVSASCSLYGPGDHLLVHDDLLGDRRVAFILYLAPWGRVAPARENGAGDLADTIEDVDDVSGWSPRLGGALELLDTDTTGQPSDVVHRVYPHNNMLAFFKVGVETFHQVDEVTSLELPRLTINGWLHGPADSKQEPNPEPPPAQPEPPNKPNAEPVVLSEWVDVAYMSPRSRAQVQVQMESDSEVCLKDFLLPDKYLELLKELRDPETPWELVGPPNRRRYRRLPASWAGALPRGHALRSVLALPGTASFFRLLCDCTDLALTSYHSLELQKWTPGDFTLLPSRERYQESRLEVVMYLGVPQRPLCGGATSYVAPEEGPGANSGALVTIPPTNNALNLVYCDAGAAGFTKYLSKMTMASDDSFFILTCTYKE